MQVKNVAVVKVKMISERVCKVILFLYLHGRSL